MFFSCINICQDLRKLFEQEVLRQSAQTSSDGHENVDALQQTYVIVILALSILP